MKDFKVGGRHRKTIEKYIWRANSMRHVYVILLFMIFLTVIYRKDTLLSRIKYKNVYVDEDLYLKEVPLQVYHSRRTIETSQSELRKVIDKNKHINTVPPWRRHHHKRKFNDINSTRENRTNKYIYSVPPWERDYDDQSWKRDNDEMNNYSLDSIEEYLIKRRMVHSIDCAAIFNGSHSEISKARLLGNDFLKVLNPYYFIHKTKDCNKFLSKRKYITNYLSKEELNFPVAYSIVIYKSVHQFERLLRTIYRPQNYYCIHVDSKMSDDDYYAVIAILTCFDNVFLSSFSFDVRWGKLSVLGADLICMRDLLKYKKWKYFINLTGQEFPLKTNREIVKILTAYNGANDVSINLDKDANWTTRWKFAGTPPGGIKPYKGSVHIAVNREFVKFATMNRTAIEFLKWTRETYIPDETFFTSINHNPQLGISGTFKGLLSLKNNYNTGVMGHMVRFKRWAPSADFPCAGIKSHNICIISVSDLQSLVNRPEMFVNKLFWDYEHYALDCLEELIHNRTVDGYYGNTNFDADWYAKQYFVRRALK